MEKILSGAPRPNFSCRVVIVNATQAPCTAVCIKWMLANRLPPGASSPEGECPTSENIEFQFSEAGTPYEEILWASPELGLKRGRSYRITVSGEASSPEFTVEETEGEAPGPEAR